jgi:hypothetical protein
VSFNSIDTICGLQHCSDLREVKLYNNTITEIPPTAFQSNKKMEKLFLQNNKIETLGNSTQTSSLATTIPPPLSYLKFLRVLRVDGNKLTNLDGIGSLLSLEELDASFNRITSIKALRGTSGGGMKNLTSLNLNNNHLSGDLGVSESISDKNSISGSSVSSTSLSFFADYLPSLRDLNVSRNKLTFLSGLKGSESITSIDASYNSITSSTFFNSLGFLPHLLDMNVSFNLIESLPSISTTTTAVFPELEVLDISGNKISASDISINACICSFGVFSRLAPNLLELTTTGNPIIKELQAEIDRGDILSLSSSISEKLISVIPSLEFFNKKVVLGTTSTLSTTLLLTDDTSSSVSISSMALPTLSIEKFSLENNAGSASLGAAYINANSTGGNDRPTSSTVRNQPPVPILMRPSSAGGIRPGSASIQRPRSSGGSITQGLMSSTSSSVPLTGLHLKSVVSREDIEAQLKSTMESLTRTRKNAAKRSAAAIEIAKGFGGIDINESNVTSSGPRGLRQALKFARDDSTVISNESSLPPATVTTISQTQNRYLAAAAMRKKKGKEGEEEKEDVENLLKKYDNPVTPQLYTALTDTTQDIINKNNGPASGYGTEEDTKIEDNEGEGEEEDEEEDERKESEEVFAELEARTAATLTEKISLSSPTNSRGKVSVPFLFDADKKNKGPQLSLSTSSSLSIDSSRPALKKSGSQAPVSLSLSSFRPLAAMSKSAGSVFSSTESTMFSSTESTIAVNTSSTESTIAVNTSSLLSIQGSAVEIIEVSSSGELDLSGGSTNSVQMNSQSENTISTEVLSSKTLKVSIKPSRPLSASNTSKFRAGETLGVFQQQDLLRHSSGMSSITTGTLSKMSDESIKKSLASIQ